MNDQACNTCGKFHAEGECNPDPMTKAMNAIWGLMYDDPTDWEYPGQVLNHIRGYLQEQTTEHLRKQDVLMQRIGKADKELEQLQATMADLDYLRNREEGAGVDITCDNPGDNDLPNCQIVISPNLEGEWRDLAFRGKTVPDCLCEAARQCREADTQAGEDGE